MIARRAHGFLSKGLHEVGEQRDCLLPSAAFSSFNVVAVDDEPSLQLHDVLDQDHKTFYWIGISQNLLLKFETVVALLGVFKK